MDTDMMKGSILMLTDHIVIPYNAVISAAREIGNETFRENDMLVITQISTPRQLPIESSSLGTVISIWERSDLLSAQWLEEIARVLKPGGTILTQTFLTTNDTDKSSSALERKILMSGFLEAQVLQTKPFLPTEVQSFTIKAKKPSWKIGTSFSLRKANTSVPKIQIDDDLDLIDEDSLLTDEDLKKPQQPLVNDCEVGTTRKACKNCTCGRAEAEEKVQKLGLTTEQLNNPQSACGSCGLGDAFRCGGCPYKGLPPFKMGEKVSLAGNFLLADI
eukprot:TRINITY_DN27497_c0_g1_i3.p1 TRINITY_DN27497_c0_g1~~TRINITY_DN27497_c0_g1_i3.p1  ORF type:complete len:275 (-),score=58.74 TRINITY_DN27497_c0_g1_i3:393-1217(-)